MGKVTALGYMSCCGPEQEWQFKELCEGRSLRALHRGPVSREPEEVDVIVSYRTTNLYKLYKCVSSSAYIVNLTCSVSGVFFSFTPFI